ncbi:MAG: DUF3604 domain-containing protein [Pseudomonadota bacterium]|jgi:hypothetical protein|nr:DUF3604 domain-containing protein [Pseudomonadota bacterium]
MKKIIVLLIALIPVFLITVYMGWFGKARHVETPQSLPLPQEIIAERSQTQIDAAKKMSSYGDKQILFGDFHVHTTFSTDAFWWSLPILGGEGVHPMADACDYARYCSSIDFWAITDHAEASTPRKWQETKDSIRQCSFKNGSETNDVIPFVGFEWTQVGPTPEEHYGHKNVIFKDLEESKLSKRPIGAGGTATNALRNNTGSLMPPIVGVLDILNFQDYSDFDYFINEVRDIPTCPQNQSSASLSSDCYEFADTPGDLVRKLEEQNLDPLIIPHGSTWGFYTPPSSSWDKQLVPEMRPEKMKIIEIMSGHGNAEEYRSYQHIIGDLNNPVCPKPTSDFLPSCWRAGQIIEDRCLQEGLSKAECEERAKKTREFTANLGLGGHTLITGETPDDWLDSGQCKDCFLPAFNHNPLTSVQYGLAITDFSSEKPLNFKWGFISASDNHRSRPGTGYKPVDRLKNTEMLRARSKFWRDRTFPISKEKPASVLELSREDVLNSGLSFQLTELERQQSFWTQGGLAAVHSESRSRDGIWDALNRKEIYATSGPRMLLWFDEVSSSTSKPMGSEITTSENPVFVVKAVGSFKQLPGCPEFTIEGMSGERIEKLCAGECYNPSSERHKVTRIEIIKITPQVNSNENVSELIMDPWLSLPCENNINGCEVKFEDKDFIKDDRQAVYYARAIQEPTETINGDALRCTYDDQGNCLEVNPCYGDYRIDENDQCLTKVEHRAWSSPIFISKVQNEQ